MRGKYSPTVSAAYQKDQNWFRNYQASMSNAENMYLNFDPEGFDSYGYDENDVDRAGNSEHEYYCNDTPRCEDDVNWKYEAALDAWDFDGTKPVQR